MSQHRSDLHILLYFSIYFPGIFTEIGGLIDINLGVKKIFSQTSIRKWQCQNFLILSHLSEPFDVPAGCFIHREAQTRMHSSKMCTTRSSSSWGGLPQCIPGYTPPGCGPGDTPQVWARRPPKGVGLEIPPGCEPGDPPRCGPGDPPGQTPQLPPWVWAWKPARHAGIPPSCCKACWDTTCNACWDTTHPLWTEFLTHATENITSPQTSFAGGN